MGLVGYIWLIQVLDVGHGQVQLKGTGNVCAQMGCVGEHCGVVLSGWIPPQLMRVRGLS